MLATARECFYPIIINSNMLYVVMLKKKENNLILIHRYLKQTDQALNGSQSSMVQTTDN